VEHDEQAAALEREADKLDEHSERVGDHIEETRREWEAKEEDPAVPGAQPKPGENEEPVPGVGVDEDRMREEPGP
jgi:hypothetical protein